MLLPPRMKRISYVKSLSEKAISYTDRKRLHKAGPPAAVCKLLYLCIDISIFSECVNHAGKNEFSCNL